MRLGLHALTERCFTLASAVDTARSAWTERCVLEVECADETGALAGRGEAASLPGYSDESLLDASRALATLGSGGALFELDTCLPAPPQVEALVAAHALPASAAFALEKALLAAAARAAGAHPAALLRGAWPGHAIAANALLGTSDAVAAAQRLTARGYRAFKLKVGRAGHWEEELATLRALATPAGIQILNSGWILISPSALGQSSTGATSAVELQSKEQ